MHEYERLVEFEFLVCEFYYHDVDDDVWKDLVLDAFNKRFSTDEYIFNLDLSIFQPFKF